MRLFPKDEFSNCVIVNSKRKEVKAAEIKRQYNEDKFNPRDGELVLACDHLAAFTEAYLALRNGVTAQAFQKALYDLRGGVPE